MAPEGPVDSIPATEHTHATTQQQPMKDGTEHNIRKQWMKPIPSTTIQTTWLRLLLLLLECLQHHGGH